MQKRNTKNSIAVHWNTFDYAIQRWLDERQELILLLLSTICTAPRPASGFKLKRQMQDLCQALMDYISAGHFEIYEELLKEGAMFQDKALEYARNLLPIIGESTDFALKLNDEIDGLESGQFSLQQVNTKLAKLMDKLEDRFEVEDQLLDLLHFSHKSLLQAHSQMVH